ncbi:hypothetical protein BO99DRAFT_409558 [Aspergillus violaceofuscus CBS 115571]|uniref:Uncharacterized protein n=1 Tax=Aspergillus violaceofuscus (strain CBS 115571) TaxID=1450538 RepID=A0A2V5HFN3_ASPV1|nr:hypothetical protein BO99DRAFT_409558 [Aspergillus violaceofuscus CBS 115571]
MNSSINLSTRTPSVMNHPLSKAANALREQIKEMIPETATEEDKKGTPKATASIDMEGNKTYSSVQLHSLVLKMVKEMEIGEGWGWNLGHFVVTKAIRNKYNQMYLVPLSEETILTPGGPLKEGTYTFTTAEPTLSPYATVIFVVPMKSAEG